MAGAVSRTCKNYFDGFHDLSNFSNNKTCKNTLGMLKIVSYFTVVLPAFFGLAYGLSSLIGRISTKNTRSTKKTSAVGCKLVGQNLEKQLEKLFKSSKKTQKLVTVDRTRVGIIFNPKGEGLKVGFLTVEDQVVLVSESPIPEEVFKQITKNIPNNYTHSTLSLGSINGQSTFKFLGFN